MTLFRATIHLASFALLSATNRATPSDRLINMAFFLTHASFEAERATYSNSLQWRRSMWWLGIYREVESNTMHMLHAVINAWHYSLTYSHDMVHSLRLHPLAYHTIVYSTGIALLVKTVDQSPGGNSDGSDSVILDITYRANLALFHLLWVAPEVRKEVSAEQAPQHLPAQATLLCLQRQEYSSTHT